MLTLGRFPAVEELFAYYSRDDIAAVLYYQARHWRMLLDFGNSLLLDVASARETREVLLRQLQLFVGNVPPSARLAKYPTMHILRDHGAGADVRYDLMIEDDPPSWRQAFQAMAQAVQVLDRYGACYRLKFSGHRSVHLCIPAAALPATLFGRDINAQFTEIDLALKRLFPSSAHVTLGLRAAYSLHPGGSLVSLPLRSEELSTFHPCMANLHTVAVDWSWFDMPADAKARNAAFLEALLTGGAGSESAPPVHARIQQDTVRAHHGEPSLPFLDISLGLRSADAATRVMAARAAFLRHLPLTHAEIAALLLDPVADVAWFGAEIARQGVDAPGVAETLHLSVQRDDYLHTLGRELLARISTPHLSAWLLAQQDITLSTSLALGTFIKRGMAKLEELPQQISAETFDEWFAIAWMLCGSALSSERPPDVLFAAVSQQLARWPLPPEELIRRQSLLNALATLRNTRMFPQMDEAALLQAAQLLRDAGYDLHGLTQTLVLAEYPYAVYGATRLLAECWWEDCLPMLIQCLHLNTRHRRGAIYAARLIGWPAVEALLELLRETQDLRFTRRVIGALGALGDPRAIPALSELATSSPLTDLRAVAADVLRRQFAVTLPPDLALAESLVRGGELEEHDG